MVLTVVLVSFCFSLLAALVASHSRDTVWEREAIANGVATYNTKNGVSTFEWITPPLGQNVALHKNMTPEKVAQSAYIDSEKWYKQGYVDAVTNYAVWHDGQQLVGVMRRPLREVLTEVEQSLIPIRY